MKTDLTLKSLDEMQGRCDTAESLLLPVKGVPVSLTIRQQTTQNLITDTSILIAKVREMQEVLKGIEWYGYSDNCPECTGYECEGHNDNCDLQKALLEEDRIHHIIAKWVRDNITTKQYCRTRDGYVCTVPIPVPSGDIYGCGDTKEDAVEMAVRCTTDYYDSVIGLKESQVGGPAKAVRAKFIELFGE